MPQHVRSTTLVRRADFDDSYAHGYTLRFEIIEAPEAAGSVLLASSGFYLDGKNDIRT